MGYNIGTRIIDEFFAKSPPGRGLCRTFRETVEVIAKEAFKMFLGVTCDVQTVTQTNPSHDHQGVGGDTQAAFSIILRENPLSDFVVLPP